MFTFECLDAVSEAGGPRPNEDALGWNAGAAWVIDGATTLEDDARAVSGGKLLAETISSFLLTQAGGTAPVRSLLPEVLKAAQERLRDGDASDLEAAASASAAAAIVRLGPAFLEYLVFGDCVVSVRRGDTIVEYRDPRLDTLDDIAIAELSRRLERGESADEARSFIQGILERHRDLLNMPDGYPSLTLDGAGLMLAASGESAVEPGDRVLLLSDGMSDAVDLFEIVTWRDLFEQVVSLPETLAEMRVVEAMDSSLVRYPRLKKSDDASAILLEIA